MSINEAAIKQHGCKSKKEGSINLLNEYLLEIGESNSQSDAHINTLRKLNLLRQKAKHRVSGANEKKLQEYQMASKYFSKKFGSDLKSQLKNVFYRLNLFFKYLIDVANKQKNE